MILGKVIGHIDSTINHPFFDGQRMMIVERTDASGKAAGGYVIAIDGGVGSGDGDSVLVLDEGNGARQIVGSTTAPVRSIIVGIVDRIDVD